MSRKYQSVSSCKSDQTTRSAFMKHSIVDLTEYFTFASFIRAILFNGLNELLRDLYLWSPLSYIIETLANFYKEYYTACTKKKYTLNII